MDLSLHIGADTNAPVDDMPDLDVILDRELTMAKHIANIKSVYFFYIKVSIVVKFKFS